MDELYFARWIYRRGIGWRLTTSGRELFYRTKTRAIENKIPDDYDFVISLPDKVLDDALNNGILTDLGITLFVRVDTKVHLKLAYLFFVLMNLRDYGHFKSARDFIDIVRFYLPVVFPKLFRDRAQRRQAGRPHFRGGEINSGGIVPTSLPWMRTRLGGRMRTS